MAKKKINDHVMEMITARNALNKLKHVAEPTDEAQAAHEALEAAMDDAAEMVAEKREALLAALK